jgi:regulator of replication initiation timing
MSKTISFHKPKHKWFLAPDFTAIALNDDSSIEEAIEIVLQAKRKSLLPNAKQKLIDSVCRAVKSDKIGALRELDDDGWKEIKIPLICRVYLKHLIMQSCSLTRQQLLECDFNSGLPFAFSDVADKVTQILALGFTRDDALEAILVTGNKRVDEAAQYLLADPDTRRRERERAKKKFNKSVPPNRHHTIIKQQKEEKQELNMMLKKSTKELEEQVRKIKKVLQEQKEVTAKIIDKRDQLAKDNQLKLYLEFLRGVVSDPTISSVEVQRIDEYRSQRNLSKKDHLGTISKLGFNEDTFDKMKNFGDGDTNDNDECLVCYEPPKDHMIMPCRHVCLCGDCAQEYRDLGDEGTCPLCDKEIEEIKQIYFF